MGKLGRAPTNITSIIGRLGAPARTESARTGWWPGMPALLPPLLLALLALAAALLVQSQRPAVAVDVGDYYDRLYLQGFHEREVAPVLPQQEHAWPAGSRELRIAEPNPAMRLAIVRLDPARATQEWGTALLTANGRRVATLRDDDGPTWQVRLPASSGPLLLRLEPWAEVGGDPDAVPIASVTLAAAASYRWTTDEGLVRLPGLGRGAWQLILAAALAHPDGSPVGAHLLASDTTLATLPDNPEPRRYRLLVPAAALPDGDLELRLRSQTFRDPRPLGLRLEGLQLTPISSGVFRPAWSLLIALAALALGSYGGLRVLRLPRSWALAAGAALLLGAAWGLLAAQGVMGFYLPRLALLAVGSAALMLALDPLVALLFRRASVPLSVPVRSGLLLLLLLSLWLKAGAMLWPYFVGIDVSWHMERVRWVFDGRLAEMYRPGGFSESVMPTAEWGDEKPLIPYSPFFYLFATSFALSPLPLVLTAHLFSALVDSSRVLLLALLARKGGYGERAALLAAALYAATPATFLLHSWGNIPTTFGLWWTLLATTFIVTAYGRLDRPGPWTTLTLLLAATFLMYTVTGVFMGVFLLLLLGTLLLCNRAEGRRPIRALAWATLAGSGLALLIYYGQFIGPILERTLPYFTQTISQGQESVGLAQESFGTYLAKFPGRLGYQGASLYYGLTLPLLFYPLVLALRPRGRLAAVLLAALGLALLFLVVGLRVPMVDKQVFYLLPFASLAGGIVFARLWRRGRQGRLVTLTCYAFTLTTALSLWLYRVASVQQ